MRPVVGQLHGRRALAAAALVAPLLLAGPVAAEPADSPEPPRVPVTLRTTETDCHEVSVLRAAHMSRLRELVPDRYVLEPAVGSNGLAGRLLLNHVTCDVQVAGRPAERTTVTLASALIDGRDGQPVPGVYLLFAETDNRLLATLHRAHGLPTVWHPGATGTESAREDGRVDMTWDVGLDAAGDDHALTPVRAAGPPVLTGPSDSGTFDAYFDGPRRDVVLQYQNDFVTACAPPTCVVDERAQLYADYRNTTAIAPLFFLPGLLTPNGLRVGYVRGSQTSELRYLPAPGSTASP